MGDVLDVYAVPTVLTLSVLWLAGRLAANAAVFASVRGWPAVFNDVLLVVDVAASLTALLSLVLVVSYYWIEVGD